MHREAFEAINWDGYRDWLETQYSRATARKGVTDLRTWLRDPRAVLATELTYQRAKDYVWAFETFNWYVQQTHAQAPLDLSLAPPQPAPPDSSGRRNRGSKKRKTVQLIMSREDFIELRRLIIADPHDTAPALDVITHTGLRVADVLRTPRDALEAAFEHPGRRIILTVKTGRQVVMPLDGAPRSWARLRDHVRASRAVNVAASCSSRSRNPNPDTDGAAYKACDRRFKHLCKLAGVHGRHNLHRARHTIGTLARELVEAVDVRDTLGHKNLQTTEIYTGQAKAAVAARTLQAVNDSLGD